MTETAESIEDMNEDRNDASEALELAATVIADTTEDGKLTEYVSGYVAAESIDDIKEDRNDACDALAELPWDVVRLKVYAEDDEAPTTVVEVAFDKPPLVVLSRRVETGAELVVVR